MGVKPIWDLVGDEVIKSSATMDNLANSTEFAETTAAFQNNPVVKSLEPEERRKIIQGAIYLDGVAYQAKKIGYDSVIGFWFVNLLTQKRHVIAMVRKKNLCRCGCGGWRTLSVIWFLSGTV